LTYKIFWLKFICEIFISANKKIMTKKEFMLKVIDALPNWKMGWGLKALIQNDQLDPDVFEKLYEIFKSSVNKTYSEVQQQQMQQRMEQVNAMKQQEEQSEEAVNLDAMISSI
jgi:hypothetical protein